MPAAGTDMLSFFTVEGLQDRNKKIKTEAVRKRRIKAPYN